MSAAVLEQWVRLENCFVDRRLARPTRPIRTGAQTIEGSIYVIEGGFDMRHTLVSVFTHPSNLPATTIVTIRWTDVARRHERACWRALC